MTDLLLKEHRSNIEILTLNDSENYNVLSEKMMDQLLTSLAEIATNDEVRVVIIKANGKAFCAGHSLREVADASDHADGGEAYYAKLLAKCSRLMQAIVQLPQPVIAQVQGVATAAGNQLVASCDLAVAADNVKFGVNGIDIGLFCSTPMVALSRNVPRKQAFEMLVSGQFISAAKAVEIGLINRAVSPDALENETLELAQTIAKKLPAAVTIGKKAFYEQLQMPLDKAYEHASIAMTENLMRPDTQEGVAAFLEKRPPKWPVED